MLDVSARPSSSRLQAQEVQSQSSYYSVNDLRLHFGLGVSTKADSVEVRWPTGKVDVFRDVQVDKLVSIREGDGIVKVSGLR